MKNKVSLIVLSAIFVIVSFAFVVTMKQRSEQDFNELVQKTIQHTLDTDSRFEGMKIKAENCMLIHEVGNRYSGTVVLVDKLRQQTFKITVIKDSNNLMYEFDRPEEVAFFTMFHQ